MELPPLVKGQGMGLQRTHAPCGWKVMGFQPSTMSPYIYK